MIRLKELREETGKSMRETAEELGMPYTTYVNYEKGTRKPSPITLVDISEHFKCTVDYLLGRSDERKLTDMNANSGVTFYNIPIVETIEGMMDELGYSCEQLEMLASIPKGKLSKFLKEPGSSLSSDEHDRILNALGLPTRFSSCSDENTFFSPHGIKNDIAVDIERLLFLAEKRPDDYAIISELLERLISKS